MKTYILFVIALVSVVMMSCSSEEAKIDAKKDAADLSKSIVELIKNAQVSDTTALNTLALKVDSIENTFFQFYGEYKKDENGASLLDSLKYYYSESGKAVVDSVINAKRDSLMGGAPAPAPAPQEAPAPAEPAQKQ